MTLRRLDLGYVGNSLLTVAVFFTISATVLAQNYPHSAYPPYSSPQEAAPQMAQGMPPQGMPPQGMPSQGGATQAPADEPGRAVARLGILNGEASIRRGDSNEWEAAAINAPLMSGDQISVAAGGRAEVQFDAAHFLRIAGDTELRLADIENGRFTIQISHGLVTWRVLRDSQSQAEISTPLVAVHPGRQAVVRVEVSADGSSHITVRKGEAEVATQKGSEKVSENSTMDVRGSMTDPEFQVVAASQRDDWDNWSDQRDSYLARAQAPRYVQQDVYGVEDLDAYGHWVYDPAYGWVWAPTVASSWAPYREGQWVWEDYYGWTWVDSAPWGWAPFHYGAWYQRAGLGWAWYPGPRIGRVWWRPAMVGFFGWGGGVGVGFGFGNVGWIPLAPFEVFHPWYGRGGFGGRAGFNAGVVRNVNIAGNFRNAGVAGGVTAVSAADFQRGNFRNTVAVDRGTLQQASLVRGTVPVTPTGQNLRFSNRAATVMPRGNAGASSQRFFGSSASSATAARTPFVQQQTSVRNAVNGQAAQPRMQSQPQAAVQTGRNQGNWQRFEGTPQTQQQGRTQAPANYLGRQTARPRQYQVSPSIIRQRSEAAAPAAAPQSRPQQSAPAPRSAPGGGSRSSGARNSGGRH